MWNRKNRFETLAFVALASALNTHAAMPPDYKGTPFDDAAYRAQQEAEASLRQQPRRNYAEALVVWDSKTPAVGNGWVGNEQPAASIRLDEADSDGKKVIHYHNKLNGYRYAIFGWQWAKPEDKPVDLAKYDALSFSIKITGTKKPQELFAAVAEHNPAPIPLRRYDTNFSDGSWHSITIPVREMKWGPPATDRSEVRGLAFMTFVWEAAEFDVQLDHITLDRDSDPQTVPPTQPAPTAASSAKPQVIPGKLECAFYDVGGEGVSYHDADPVNILSGVLNQGKAHQRPHATSYHWNFRKDEGVDISYTKDFADFNHVNRFAPSTNQFYVGGAENGEWCNYTVDVKKAGHYKVIALYGNGTNAMSFSINHQPACDCKFPVTTGGAHGWNKGEVGTISFAEAGVQLLTLHYSNGNNLAYFELVEAP